MKRKPLPVRPGVPGCAHCGGVGKRTVQTSKFGLPYTVSIDCVCIGGRAVVDGPQQQTIFEDGKAKASRSEE